ncbi:MAG: nicotinate (nicotinamide) nucleotide adenylyltransferase [Paludibacter sp.]
MHIALFFGSFNPVHLGHLNLGKYMIENKLADEVWYVVSPCNPLKDQKDLIDEFLRLDMLIEAIKDQPQLKASDIEFTMPIPSYTIDTLNKLSVDFPKHIFSLVIGSDNALIFDKWKNYNEILEKYDVIVYPRKGYDFAKVAGLYPQMKLVDTPVYDISSTQIREFVSHKKNVAQWLHPSVYQFIIENNLYTM